MIAFVTCVFDQSCEHRKGFIEGRQSQFKVKHQDRKRPSYTDSEVEWDPQAMLDNPHCYDLDNVELRYSVYDNIQMGNNDLSTSNNGDKRNWITAGRETYKLTDVRRPKWVVKVVPCLMYDFQIAVRSKDEKSHIYYSSLKSLEPADKKAIEKSSNVPEMPKFVGAQFSDNKTVLKFLASPCVNSYELEMRELTDYDKIPCTEYELKITPHYDNLTVNSKSVPFKINPSDDNSSGSIIQLKGKLS